MLRPEIVCARCRQGSARHTQYVMDAQGRVVYGGECVTLRDNVKRHGQLESLR